MDPPVSHGRDGRPTGQARNGDRNTQIERIVAGVIRRRSSGALVEDSAVEGDHPHLMPELGERLRMLRAIEEAADQNGQRSGPSDPIDDVDVALAEEWAFLREALHGYELLERLRGGGQGVVYQAVQQSTGRTVAVKVLLNGPLATERQRQRFAREVALISRLRHPNIVTLYDSGVVRGRHYYAMEFVDGLPLDDYFLLHRPTARERVRLLTTACRALSYAHQRGIIHRDLKPSNILVDAEGEPHILDFGLAKELSYAEGPGDASSPSITGQVLGTLPYLSPEQVSGLDDEVDVRSDIYTLGVVLYEALTGCFPYPVQGSAETVRVSIRDCEPERLRKTLARWSPNDGLGADQINDDLEAIILKSLEKDKSERYQSAAALADDLDNYLAGDAVVAKAHRSLYQARKALRRYRVHLTIAAAAVGLLFAGLSVGWYRAERLAQMYQAGLQMGSFLKLGSVERDEGRIDQAVAMFEKAVEMGESVASSDPAILHYLYTAYDRLAKLYYENERPDLADPYCDAAVVLAERLVREDPESLEWRRLLAHSYLLRGHMAFSREDWSGALGAYDQAASSLQPLAFLQPDNVSLKAELAYVRGQQGKSCRKLKRHDDALKHYQGAYQLRKELFDAAPQSWDRILDLVESENRLAVWHLAQRTPEHDRRAAEWLSRARERLRNPATAANRSNRQRDVDRMLDAINVNEAVIDRRSGSLH